MLRAGASNSSLQAAAHKDVVEVLEWTLVSTNKFYHGLHRHGVWIPPQAAAVLVRHGYAMTDASHNLIAEYKFVMIYR